MQFLYMKICPSVKVLYPDRLEMHYNIKYIGHKFAKYKIWFAIL